MTPEMITKARANCEKLRYKNVEFRQGQMESLPIESNTIDVVISNCVLNLVCSVRLGPVTHSASVITSKAAIFHHRKTGHSSLVRDKLRISSWWPWAARPPFPSIASSLARI